MKNIFKYIFASLIIFSAFTDRCFADLPPFLDYSTSAQRYKNNEVEIFSGLYAYQRFGLWGFSGSVNIQPSFSGYEKIGTKYIKVYQNGYCGLIERDDGLIFPTIYDDINTISIPNDASVLQLAFSNEYDYFKVKQNGKVGVLNAIGKVIVPLQYHDITYIGSNYLITKYNNRKGIYGVFENKEIIPPIYEDMKVGGIYDGLKTIETLFYIKQNGKWGLINQQGKIFLKPEYDDVKPLNISYVAVKKFHWGIVDMNENIIIPYKYEKIELSGKYFKVKLNGKWGAITADNKVVIPIDKGPLEINKLIKNLPL